MNLKTHIITTLAFLLLIGGAIYLFGGKEETPETATNPLTERFIQIVSATWGMNCNGQVERMIRTQEKDNDGTIPTLARKDNALLALSRQCNNKETCSVKVTPEFLGKPNVTSCHKNFTAEYRCFMTDRAHAIELEDGGSVTIDCTEKAS